MIVNLTMGYFFEIVPFAARLGWLADTLADALPEKAPNQNHDKIMENE